MSGINWSSEVQKERKMGIYNTIIKGISFYGSETWRVKYPMKTSIEATQMDVLRRTPRKTSLEGV